MVVDTVRGFDPMEYLFAKFLSNDPQNSQFVTQFLSHLNSQKLGVAATLFGDNLKKHSQLAPLYLFVFD